MDGGGLGAAAESLAPPAEGDVATSGSPRRAWSPASEALAAWTVVAGAFLAGHLLLTDQLAGKALEGRLRVDGLHYRRIAAEGYSWDPPADDLLGWFPGYPLLVRVVHLVVPNWTAATLVTAALAGAAATALFITWTAEQGFGPRARRVALAGLLAYPYAFFLLGVPYAEATFLAFAIGMFLAVERDRLWLAAALGVGATATRLVGVVAVVAAAALVAERRGVLARALGNRRDGAGWRVLADRARSGRAALIPLLGLAGVLAFLGYCWIAHHEPFGYFIAQDQRTGNQPPTWWGTWVKWSLVSNLPTMTARHIVGAVSHLVLTVAVAASIPAVRRRFGGAYALYTAGVVALIWFGGWDFPSAGRYLLAAFPTLALVGERLSRRGTVVVPLVAVSGLVCFGFSIAFLEGVAYSW